MACQDTLICGRLALDVNVEVVACSIKQKESSQPLIICALYRPPNNDLSYMTDQGRRNRSGQSGHGLTIFCQYKFIMKYNRLNLVNFHAK